MLQLIFFAVCLFIVIFATFLYIKDRIRDPEAKKTARINLSKGWPFWPRLELNNLTFKDEILIAAILAIVSIPIITFVFITNLRK